MFYYDLYSYGFDLLYKQEKLLFPVFREYKASMYSFLPDRSKDVYRIRSPTSLLKTTD